MQSFEHKFVGQKYSSDKIDEILTYWQKICLSKNYAWQRFCPTIFVR